MSTSRYIFDYYVYLSLLRFLRDISLGPLSHRYDAFHFIHERRLATPSSRRQRIVDFFVMPAVLLHYA